MRMKRIKYFDEDEKVWTVAVCAETSGGEVEEMNEIIVKLTSDHIRVKGGEYVQDLVRCKECKWYDPPHILHKDGTRTDVDEDAPLVTVDVGINCGGQCIHHIDLKTYCVNHDRENPDDNERIVIFRKPDDFCSYGVRKESE